MDRFDFTYQSVLRVCYRVANSKFPSPKLPYVDNFPRHNVGSGPVVEGVYIPKPSQRAYCAYKSIGGQKYLQSAFDHTVVSI
jgi:hypothetical protein